MNIRKFLESGTIKACALALAMGLVACGDDNSSGSDDDSLTPVESEIDLADGKKVTCDEKMEGAVAALANGDFRRCEDGAWVKISREEALEADEILGYSSSSVKDGSSSSGKATSSSSTKDVGSSSSVKSAWQYLNPSIEYGEFTDDRDGQVYKIVTIGEGDKAQTWMAENLNYNSNTKEATNSWCGGGEGEKEGDCTTYGRLYTWAAAVEDACPSGWHLPSNAEWTALYNAIGETVNAGKILKANADLWASNTGIDKYGFTVLPAGNRNGEGKFDDRGDFANFWSSTENEDFSSYAYYQHFSNTQDNVLQLSNYGKNNGFSVRCLMGSNPAVTPGDDPAVTPDPVPGANSSSSDTPSVEPESSSSIEEPAEVMSNGYYSENCPEGRDCRYATTTEFLNQEMLTANKYGEILDTRDGQVYKTIEICDKEKKKCQTWMAQNLNYAPDPGKVSGMGLDAWSGCYGDGRRTIVSSESRDLTAEEIAANCSKYGRLYTWEVAMDDAACAYGKNCGASLKPTNPVRGICPQGWHLPSHYELEVLINFVDPSFGYGHPDGGYSSTAKALKTTSDWIVEGNGTNATGFSALPGGHRSGGDEYFSSAGRSVLFWSSSEYGSDGAFFLYLQFVLDDAELGKDGSFHHGKSTAGAVRCLMD